jgi:hypothetical protein
MKFFVEICRGCVGRLLARGGKQGVSVKRGASGGDIFVKTKMGRS